MASNPGDYPPPPQPPPSHPSVDGAQASNFLKKLLTFDAYIGGTLIKIIYYVGLAFIVIGALFLLVSSMGMGRYSGSAPLIGLLASLVSLTFGVLFWRFVCEMWMVLFDIHKRLGEIRDRLPPR